MEQIVTVFNLKKSNKYIRILLILIFYFSIALFLMVFNKRAILPYIFGFFFGFILQRSRFCFAASFRDIFLIKNTNLTRAVLLMLTLTTVGFTLVSFLSGDPYILATTGKVYPIGLHTLVGGIIFGFGMVIAGSCVSGCLVRMGEGYLMHWVNFFGILLGSSLGAWHLGWWLKTTIDKSPIIFLPLSFGWPLAILFQSSLIAVLYFLALKVHLGKQKLFSLKRLRIAYSAKKQEKIKEKNTKNFHWSYTTGALLISLTNTLMFYFWGEPWGITGGLTHLSGGVSAKVGLSPLEWAYFEKISSEIVNSNTLLAHPLIFLVIAMVIGSHFSSSSHMEFRLRCPRTKKYFFTALLGGTLMGYSSRVVMGCNIGGFFSGISSFSLHAWLFGFSILIGAYLGGKVLLKFIMD